MGIPTTLTEVLRTYEPVIGLEVHAQLRTESKLFCGAPNRYDPEQPNQAVTEYCAGLPGQLPVLNVQAVDMAITAGLALECTIRTHSVWARKQYFYPDLPKGYQISQYDKPICEGGRLVIRDEQGEQRTIGITRIHMEEDAGKSIHVKGRPYSLVDYSRAGVPLIEIVSDPDLRSAQEATQYLRELRSILRTLGVCDGNMERGNFRCDANVSIRPRGQTSLGERVELKNINSFRFVEQAIEIEIIRHAQVLEQGGTISQETRLFDPDRKQTRTMRSKEEAEDYRYFPDPDLPPLVVSESHVNELREILPELPANRRQRWMNTWNIPEEHAISFAEERALADFFDAAVGSQATLAPAIANLIKTEILRELKDTPEAIAESKLKPEDLRTLIVHREEGKISSSQAKKIFAKLWKGAGSIEALLKAEGEQIQDLSVLTPIIEALIQANPKQAEQLKAGQSKLAGYFVGQVMKQTKGQADPALVQKLLTKALEKMG
ncbi:MAG: Asp-tRNA(Asn)/Glu-tRNA(Gln) amidotransferase subunit GatB [Myxococcales bacterium]|nr:Asp-tRNA(Asn)/Glu-tRNA(Gln) amidotransferase subunit GatB [Myxococcales bacterium]